MQRPPHDKDYVQQCIKQLHKFLLSQGFPGTVTEKDIQSTTLEDFKKVTELIHAFVELSFQIPTNEFDEETLKMLKDLGYSYPSTTSTPLEARVIIWLAWISEWILEWYSVKMVYCLIEEVFFPDVSDEPCDVEEGAEFNKPLRRCLCDLYRSFMERAGVFEEKDEAFLDHMLTVMSLVEWLKKELENSCSSETHKTAPENETAGRVVDVEHIRLILERQKLTADVEHSNREKDELLQTNQRLKQSIEEMEQKERNKKVTVSKTQKKKLRRRRRK